MILVISPSSSRVSLDVDIVYYISVTKIIILAEFFLRNKQTASVMRTEMHVILSQLDSEVLNPLEIEDSICVHGWVSNWSARFL